MHYFASLTKQFGTRLSILLESMDAISFDYPFLLHSPSPPLRPSPPAGRLFSQGYCIGQGTRCRQGMRARVLGGVHLYPPRTKRETGRHKFPVILKKHPDCPDSKFSMS